jgi:hypothetical protein
LGKEVTPLLPTLPTDLLLKGSSPQSEHKEGPLAHRTAETAITKPFRCFGELRTTMRRDKEGSLVFSCVRRKLVQYGLQYLLLIHPPIQKIFLSNTN